MNWPNGTLGQARDWSLAALRWTRESLLEMARFPDQVLNSPWAQRLWQRTDAILTLAEGWVAGRRWLLFLVFSLPALGALTYLGIELYNHDRLFNNDSYYHVGLAREYAKGWVDSYKWLPHTPLAQDPFPNLYLLMHLALAPVHWFVEDGIEALRLSRLLTTMLLALSMLAVQWLLRLPWGFLWAPLGLASMPLVGQYLFTLKGGALFFPLFAWWCYALAAERYRLLFFSALVATLGYAGTWVLVPLSFIYVATESYASRRVRAQPFLVTALAVGLGVLVHPSFPLNIEHIARELSTPGVIRELSHELTVGFHIGIEWRTLKGREFGHFMGCLAMAVIFPALAWRSSVDARAQGVLAMLLALSLGSVWVGAKMLILACVGALALAPWLWHRFIGEGARWQALLCIMVLGWAIYAVPRLAPSANVEDNRKSEQSALAMGAWLRDNTPKDTKVAAFWNHYPKFVYGGEGHNRFLAGMNTLFLYWQDKVAYRALLHMFNGSLEDPEVLLELLDFQYLLLDDLEGEPFIKALERARSRPALEEIALPAGLEQFKLFKPLPKDQWAQAQAEAEAEAASEASAEAAPEASPEAAQGAGAETPATDGAQQAQPPAPAGQAP